MCDQTSSAPREPITLPYGVKRKLFVDRKAASRLESPIIVEEPDGKRWYASNVAIKEPGSASWSTVAEFKWTGRNDIAPALWVETFSALELTP